ncbi:MAG: O-antigen ligase family protein [Sphingobium sp.]
MNEIGARRMRQGMGRGEAQAAAREAAGWSEIAIFGLCIFAFTTPFVFALTGENPNVRALMNVATNQQESGSQTFVYVMRAVAGIIPLLFMSRRMRDLARNAGQLKPLLPFGLWALLSMFWSDDLGVTMRSTLTMWVLWLAGYCMALRLRPEDFARAIIAAGGIMGIASVAYTTLNPYYGIHQLTDATQSVHAGAWRAVYGHKNFLAHVAAFFAVATFWVDRTIIPWQPLKYGLIALFLFLIARSTSASALPIGLAAGALVWILIMADPKTRVRALVVFAPAMIALYWGTGMILDALGRDSTFTGRTDIWNYAWEALMDRPFTGHGFVSLSYGSFAFVVRKQLGVSDPHSGYFDVALGTGLIGLALFLVMLVYALLAARRLYVAGGGERQVAIALSGLLIAWLASSFTESSSRPLTAMGGLGLFAVGALLSIPRPKVVAIDPFAEMRRRMREA